MSMLICPELTGLLKPWKLSRKGPICKKTAEVVIDEARLADGEALAEQVGMRGVLPSFLLSFHTLKKAGALQGLALVPDR